MSMNPDIVELCTQRAVCQAKDVIQELMAETLQNFEHARSDKFKLAITIAGTRKGRTFFTLKTSGKSSVGLKTEAETDPDNIDFGGPDLFQIAEKHGAKVSVEVKDAPAGE